MKGSMSILKDKRAREVEVTRTLTITHLQIAKIPLMTAMTRAASQIKITAQMKRQAAAKTLAEIISQSEPKIGGQAKSRERRAQRRVHFGEGGTQMEKGLKRKKSWSNSI